MTRTAAMLSAAILLAATAGGVKAAESGFFAGSGKTQTDKTQADKIQSAAAQPAAPSAGGTTGSPATPTLADLDARDNELAELWTRLPYTARHVMFVSRRAGLYGDYEQRPSSVFAPGEKLLTYLEPVGYSWKALAGGVFGLGVTTDFEILARDGKVLAGQRAFQKIDLTSHYRNREFFVNLTLTIDGIAPGDYVLAYTLHDNVGGRTTRVEQPFTITASS
jgi:hypothetical protein